MSLKVVPTTGPTCKFIDLYHGDSLPNLAQLKADGYVGVFHKATQGADFTDNLFASRFAAIKAAGLTAGAYHFWSPGVDPIAQAEHFVKTVGHLMTPEDMIMFDWEASEHTGPHDVQTLLDEKNHAYNFLTTVERLLKKKFFAIYTGPYFIDTMVLDARFMQWAYWGAEYQVSALKVATPWTDWLAWQYGSKGVDYNVFRGNAESFKAYVLGRNTV